MKKHTEPMTCDTFYHIYNRGINGENLFREERNYGYFLSKYAEYVQPIAETYAYCLLRNHFHILIRIRKSEDIIQNLGKNLDIYATPIEVADEASKLVSKQFSKLFNSYAQAINKAQTRTGGLFEEPFRRIPIKNERYIKELVYYIHTNPQKHGFVESFTEYPHSSYHSHILTAKTRLNRDDLIGRFGTKDEYQKYHLSEQILENLSEYEIEFD